MQRRTRLFAKHKAPEDQTARLVRIIFKYFTFTTPDSFQNIPLAESFLDHVPDGVQPDTVSPHFDQLSDSLQQFALIVRRLRSSPHHLASIDSRLDA
ncbi:MAG TPA: hypothetical protein VK363_09820 [Pyrinomonadaceae bacterium]|nr:hypothetical protein [Pyrinomonadaceae bacterium]